MAWSRMSERQRSETERKEQERTGADGATEIGFAVATGAAESAAGGETCSGAGGADG